MIWQAKSIAWSFILHVLKMFTVVIDSFKVLSNLPSKITYSVMKITMQIHTLNMQFFSIFFRWFSGIKSPKIALKYRKICTKNKLNWTLLNSKHRSSVTVKSGTVKCRNVWQSDICRINELTIRCWSGHCCFVIS